MLNKPKDYVTTSDDPQQRKTVMDLVKNACPERIYPVGRLDRNTTGVLLLTNDGDLASKLTHPKFLKKKIYHVHLDKAVTAHDMQQIAEGITLDDGEITRSRLVSRFTLVRTVSYVVSSRAWVTRLPSSTAYSLPD